ncbi:hypothetical protein [Halomicrobium mukohataei]|uniref:Uncharacterized protein n=2 Tax=Halomicrobium mukohataei TaxID=57705 RepID=C7P549_HALMD|nr:hypothetical protein [Halomicrobium mukohataei]ACV49444.1 hypothetical protein Hmuk_3358 [Halomicrobium mukohataei DSM 12286]QCD67268.1 hypothetical protein E5139_16655 [Halomicrobium mukohataei]
MLEDAIRVIVAVPKKERDHMSEQVTEHLKQNEAYEVADILPEAYEYMTEIIFFRGDFILSVYITDGFRLQDYPDCTLIEVDLNIGQEIDESSESDFLATDEIQALIETTVDLYTGLSTSPKVGFGEETYQSEVSPISGESFPPEERRFLTWCDIFSPAEVDAIGRETLLSAPAPRAETLADGSILLISKNPVDNTPPEAVSEHVGIQTMTDYSDHVSRSEFYDE